MKPKHDYLYENKSYTLAKMKSKKLIAKSEHTRAHEHTHMHTHTHTLYVLVIIIDIKTINYENKLKQIQIHRKINVLTHTCKTRKFLAYSLKNSSRFQLCNQLAIYTYFFLFSSDGLRCDDEGSHAGKCIPTCK